MHSIQPGDGSTDEERERLEELDADAVHADSKPDNPGESGNIDTSTLRGGASST